MTSITTEIWAPLPNYEGIYEVSDQGRIKSLKRTITRNKMQVTLSERILKLGTDKHGYRYFIAQGKGSPKTIKAHRAVLTAFVGPLPEGMVTRHLNGNASDNRLINLRYGTQRENSNDARIHGTMRGLSLTHCIRQHKLVEPNITAHTLRKGQRGCKACSRATSRIWDRNLAPESIQTIADEYYASIMAGTDGPQTHCKREHLLEHPNLVQAAWDKNHARSCRACCNARSQLRRRPELNDPDGMQRLADENYNRIMNGDMGRTSTHCERGHRLEQPNLRPAAWHNHGKRHCRACGNAQSYIRHHPELYNSDDKQRLADEYYALIINDTRGTLCKRKHLLEHPNLIPSAWNKYNRRVCLACHRATSYTKRHPEFKDPGALQHLADQYYAKLNTP